LLTTRQLRSRSMQVMCRGNANRCVLLGTDQSGWSEFAPLPPHRALIDSFPYFEDAVRAAASGDMKRGRAELLRVDSNTVRDWYIEHALMAGLSLMKQQAPSTAAAVIARERVGCARPPGRCLVGR